MGLAIITHRGLEDGGQGEFGESTLEAFGKHLGAGFSLEFDPNFTKDGIVVWHDKDLKRLTAGEDTRLLREVATEEVLTLPWQQGSLCTLTELLGLMVEADVKSHALHLKAEFQDECSIDRLMEVLCQFDELKEKLFIFDLKCDAAEYIRSLDPEWQLGASVAHDYDIMRYNSFVGGTLFEVNEAKSMRSLYDWVWLDEWDRLDVDGGRKVFYTKELVDGFKQQGFKVALVTPEIHGTSPGLLGGEAHEDACEERLYSRMKEFAHLNLDAICTDWPKGAHLSSCFV